MPKMLCATGIPRRSLLLSSMSSINKDALCKSPIMSYTVTFVILETRSIRDAYKQSSLFTLIASSTAASATLSHNWKQSTSLPLTSFPGTPFIYLNDSNSDSSGLWGNTGSDMLKTVCTFDNDDAMRRWWRQPWFDDDATKDHWCFEMSIAQWSTDQHHRTLAIAPSIRRLLRHKVSATLYRTIAIL